MELRALRTAVREAQGRVVQPADAAAALAPLRGAVEAIAQEQRHLAQRQTELVHELQRWSQLVTARTSAADDAAVAATHDQVVRRDRDDSTVSAFTEAADGVELVDTSELSLDESIEAVLDVVATVTADEA